MKDDLQKLAQELLVMKTAAAKGAEGAQTQSKTMVGTVVSVNDPLEQGRVKVVVDEVSPNDAGQTSSDKATSTSWINTQDSFLGKQTSLLVGQRVVLNTIGNDPNKLIVGNVIHDENSSAAALGTTMTRMPLYKSGSLPTPCAANLGCTVIELDGPCESDWLCTCLRRRGTYLWIRHIDLNHMHADQDDGRQPPDAAGDSEQPVNEGPIWDKVAPTSDKAYNYQGYDEMDSGWFGGA